MLSFSNLNDFIVFLFPGLPPAKGVPPSMKFQNQLIAINSLTLNRIIGDLNV